MYLIERGRRDDMIGEGGGGDEGVKGRGGGGDEIAGEGDCGGGGGVGSRCSVSGKGDVRDVDTAAVDDDDAVGDGGGMIDDNFGGVLEGSDDPVRLSNFFWLLFSVLLRWPCCLNEFPFLLLRC